jgi:transcriptional regulator with XRE-family HTH domain
MAGALSFSSTGPKEFLVLGLRLARHFRNLTQMDVSYRAGLRQTLISAFERGRTIPTEAELQRLARALGVADPSVLLQDFPDPTTMPTAWPEAEHHATR